MTPTVFIHTNHKQILGALVSQYSLQRNSRHPERFETQIINSEDHPFLKAREGQPFLREGKTWLWRYDDLQSFTPLRFMRPACPGLWARRSFASTGEDEVMAIDIAELERLIKDGIPNAQVWIEDLRGDGDHYAATVVSPAFSGMSRVQQHQMVYKALKGKMGGELHELHAIVGRLLAPLAVLPRSIIALVERAFGPPPEIDAEAAIDLVL